MIPPSESPPESPTSRSFHFDGWTLRTMPRELSRLGQRVPLQDQPLQILEELLSRPHELVTREQLVARLWPRGVVDFDGSLNTAVRKLRTALQDDAETPRYVETLPRQGYRFIGQVQTPGEISPATRPRPRMFQGRGTWLAVALALALAAVLGSYPAWRAAKSVDSAATPAQASIPRLRVAVLPFENLSPDPADAFFTDGLHEAVLATLASRVSNIEVISRTTMMTYRATDRRVPEIARDLGATHVLEGSVRRESPTVRLSLRLIDAHTDTPIWTHDYDRQLVSAMSLQADVAAEVAQRLAVRLSPNREQLPPSANPAAYDLYLKASLEAQGFEGRASRERVLEAEAWLSRAIALDPIFAAAYLERARVRLRKFANSYDISSENLRATRGDLDEARELAGDVPLVSMTEGWYAQIVDWDMDKARRMLAMPAVLASRDVAVLMDRASVLATDANPHEAIDLYRQAARLDPANRGLVERWVAVLWNLRRPAEALEVLQAFHRSASPRIAFDFAFTGLVAPLDERVNPVSERIDADSRLMARVNRFRLRGRLDDAVVLLEQMKRSTMRQDSPSPVSIPAIGVKPVAELLGWTLLLKGDLTGARHAGLTLREFVAQEKATKWNAWFLRVLAAEGELFSGNREQAIREIRDARRMIPERLNVAVDRYLPAVTAMILAWAGAEDEAIALLESLSTRYPGLGPAEIVREPLYTVPLQANPRFQVLATRLEAEIAANVILFARASK
ncbi:MAG TPA: winged helix-turn-helix domain-containing protein [Steroidobacteraceae bacterium]